jgi:hypothetical protein
MPGWDAAQRALLEREGIAFDARGRIDLERWRWRPGASARPKARRGARKQTGRGRK